MSDKDTVTISKVTLWQGITLVMGLLLIASVLTGGFSFTRGDSVQAEAPSAANPPAMGGHDAPTAEINLEGAYIKGDPDAPVTIVEFSDFQCPFCSRFYAQTLPSIEQAYVETGQVKFAYMHFPLQSIHPQATPAALAAECAGEQGEEKFWEMHDLMFDNQRSLNEANYAQWAADIGLDVDQYNNCYDSGKYNSKINEQLQRGQAAGVRGTPGFLVNGQLVSGAQPFAAFQAIIDRELAN